MNEEYETIKVWITEYALTKGIIEAEAEDHGAGMIVVRKFGGYFDGYFHGKDWHRTEADAITRAEEMRNKKIESHRKAIAKLEKLNFTVQK